MNKRLKAFLTALILMVLTGSSLAQVADTKTFKVEDSRGNQFTATYTGTGPVRGDVVLKMLEGNEVTLKNVVNPDLMPQGRQPIEPYVKSTFSGIIVHLFQPSVKIETAVYGTATGIKILTTTPLTPVKGADGEWRNFRVIHADKGLFYPYRPELYTLSPNMKAFLGVKSIFEDGPFPKGEVKTGGTANNIVLSAFPKFPLTAETMGWYAYQWQTPQGPRWAFLVNSDPTYTEMTATQARATYLDYRRLDKDWAASTGGKPEKVWLAQREDQKFDVLASPNGVGKIQVLATLNADDTQTLRTALANHQNKLDKTPQAKPEVKVATVPKAEVATTAKSSFVSPFGNPVERSRCYQHVSEYLMGIHAFEKAIVEARQCPTETERRLLIEDIARSAAFVLTDAERQQVMAGNNEWAKYGIKLYNKEQRIQADNERTRQFQAGRKAQQEAFQRDIDEHNRNRTSGGNSTQNNSSGYGSTYGQATTDRYNRAVDHAAEQERQRIRDAQWGY